MRREALRRLVIQEMRKRRKPVEGEGTVEIDVANSSKVVGYSATLGATVSLPDCREPR